jgi:hypothetical protein
LAKWLHAPMESRHGIATAQFYLLNRAMFVLALRSSANVETEQMSYNVNRTQTCRSEEDVRARASTAPERRHVHPARSVTCATRGLVFDARRYLLTPQHFTERRMASEAPLRLAVMLTCVLNDALAASASSHCSAAWIRAVNWLGLAAASRRAPGARNLDRLRKPRRTGCVALAVWIGTMNQAWQ